MKKLVIVAIVCIVLSVGAIIFSAIFSKDNGASSIYIEDWGVRISLDQDIPTDITVSQIGQFEELETVDLSIDKLEEPLSHGLPEGEPNNIIATIVRSKDKQSIADMNIINISDTISAEDGYNYSIVIADQAMNALDLNNTHISDSDKKELQDTIDILLRFGEGGSVKAA